MPGQRADRAIDWLFPMIEDAMFPDLSVPVGHLGAETFHTPVTDALFG